MNKGRTIKLFLVDGSPTGLKTAEIHNWTGHLLYFPRSKTGEALARPDSAKTGVYFLLGQNPDHPSGTSVYIGEGDNVAKRIRSHASDSGKEFWQFACVVTSKDANLTKAHVRYLESRLIELAHRAKRADVQNATGPGPNPLPDSDVSDMEYFLDQIEVVLPIVGMDFLRERPSLAAQPTEGTAQDSNSEVPILRLHAPKYGVEATAVEADGEFVVAEGSFASKATHTTNQYEGVRQQLIDTGVLISQSTPDVYVFAEDTVFRSPSEAAAVILNRNANGRTEWKIASTGQALRDWQDALLEPAVED